MLPDAPMKIERIEVFLYTRPLKREFWMSLARITQSREIIVRLTTDVGTQGIGQCHGGPMEQVGRIITELFREVLIGQTPSNTSGCGRRCSRITTGLDGLGTAGGARRS